MPGGTTYITILRRIFAAIAALLADNIAFAENMLYNIRMRRGE